MSLCKLQKSLQIGNLGTDSAAKESPWGNVGGGLIGEECGWSARGLKRAEPFWTHVSAYKLQKSLEMGNFGTNKGGSKGKAAGGGDRGAHGASGAFGTHGLLTSAPFGN